MQAIVLDGGLKSALATVRALGKEQVEVICGAEHSTGMALHSRYTKKRFVYHSPLNNPETFLNDLDVVLASCKEKPVLYAFSDATFLTLARNRKRWEGKALMPLSSPDSIETAFDKNKTLELAQTLSVPIPPTYKLFSHADLESALSKLMTFPIVVKPPHSASWKEGKGIFGSVLFAFSHEEVRTKVHEIFERSGEYPLLEEYIHGGEFGFEALCSDGKILSFVSHRRIRSLSPTGGAAVVKETIEPDPSMKDASEKLLKALLWEGVAMIEFKKNEKTGEYLLLEINGRFWGSLPLAIFAGLNFPTKYMELAQGNLDTLRSSAPDTYERGVCSRHFLGDVRHLLHVLFANDPMRCIVYPKRISALADFFRPVSGMRYDVFDSHDFMPALMEVVDRF